jgi:hypothetical protein
MIFLYSQLGKRKENRMANLSIPSIRERLFNTSKHEQSTQRNSSNPFAVSSFKGNVLTADVFESSTKQNQPSFTGKLKSSALVGSISGIGERFHNIINSAVQFGTNIKNSVVNGWNKLNGIEISMDFLNPVKDICKSAKKVLFETPISDLMSSSKQQINFYKTTSDMASARSILSENIAMAEALI